MPCAELWILDQTRAWTVFRDHHSVDLIKPGQGALGLTFRQLWGIRARRYKAAAPPRPKIGNSEELDRACAAGKLRALRLFPNGTTERIPAREWRDGTPKDPQQIRFLPAEVMAIFPTVDNAPASQDAVEYNRPTESTISDSDLSLPPSSTPLASAFTATSTRSGTVP
jgi:hypothetical protein